MSIVALVIPLNRFGLVLRFLIVPLPRCSPLSVDSSICTNSLQHSLRPELAPKRRGRKRKRDTPSESTDLEGHESILLEGAVGKQRDVALLFKWKHLLIEQASWALLSIQSPDLQEWWAEERELRYPFTPPAAFQIQLVSHRDGTLARD